MRRNARILIIIAIITAICGTILGVQKINLNNFERGSDNILGLSLGLDLQGGSHLIYQALNPETGTAEGITSDQMESLSKTIERRINSSGLGEPIIQIIGDDRLLIQLPGIKDPGRAKSLIGETARLEFKHRTTDVVPKPVDTIVPQDVVSVTAEMVTASMTPKSEDTKVEENEDDEYYESLILEFTESGADKFYQVYLDLVTSIDRAYNAAQTSGSSLTPSRLGINISGNESLRFEAQGLQIIRLDDNKEKFVKNI